MQKTVRVTVKGRVTGVGFRYNTMRQARSLGTLRGYVRNMDARTVEALIQGPEPDVDNMVDWMKQGPSGARVTDAQVNQESNSDHLRPFHIEH